MPTKLQATSRWMVLPCALMLCSPTLRLSASPLDERPTDALTESERSLEKRSLSDLKELGRERSRFAGAGVESSHTGAPEAGEKPQADLATFAADIQPLLREHCLDCHGTEDSEGNIRIDTLDPNLLAGADTEWWAEIFSVIAKGEMPPPDASDLSDAARQRMVDWLSTELQTASKVRRQSASDTAFRRMTRYEFNYALQDLLGLPWDFAKDLPPEAHAEDGFQNSTPLLHLSVTQLESYHRLARRALHRATVSGEPPQTLYWNVAMEEAATREWPKQEQQISEAKKKYEEDSEELARQLEQLQTQFREPPKSGAYYRQSSSGRMAQATWSYNGAKYAFAPEDAPSAFPEQTDCVAVLPAARRAQLTVELGNQLPDEGTLRVTVRASRVKQNAPGYPTLQLLFGWRASNEGRALLPVADGERPVTASPDAPQILQWDVPLGELYPRNSVRKTSPMGALPSPSEYIRFANTSASPGDIQIDFVQVAAPVYDHWPPKSHQRIFAEREPGLDEQSYARETISAFMERAWRRPISKSEIDRKLELFEAMRPECQSPEEAIVEVLASVLASPQFLFVTRVDGPGDSHPRETDPLAGYSLAHRLALFLWCSLPDQELITLASQGRLAQREVLAAQVDRMLDDPRSERFTRHFVQQWLNLELLEFQNFEQHVRGFDPLLKEALQEEPIALFEEVLRTDASMLDFIHCDYALVNERLAQHYGMEGVYGNHFRRVPLETGFRRGGLMTQAGLLAMNADWPDSHPLKRAIWLLENLLNDPPPPPPPAVPQIDLADPEIAKMTLKERIEDHRNHAACLSCHVKIDPWGIAFENYDALGKWRDEIQGKPIDASSELFNHQTLDGMDGLKRFLLLNRQDQFVQAIVSKLATYALGRPLKFADRAEIDTITAQVRGQGDGLRSAIKAIVVSDLFRTQ